MEARFITIENKVIYMGKEKLEWILFIRLELEIPIGTEMVFILVDKYKCKCKCVYVCVYIYIINLILVSKYHFPPKETKTLHGEMDDFIG